MPHTGLPPCLSGDGIREGRERRQSDCPGLDDALSPASPPGFVTALTTARSRDVPAECFDERLPRRLPHVAARVLALVFSLHPASSDDPIELTGHLLRCDLLQATSPSPPERPANCNGCATKKKPGTLKLYKMFRSTMPNTANTATITGWWIRYIDSEFLPSGRSGLAGSGASSSVTAGRTPSPYTRFPKNNPIRTTPNQGNKGL